MCLYAYDQQAHLAQQTKASKVLSVRRTPTALGPRLAIRVLGPFLTAFPVLVLSLTAAAPLVLAALLLGAGGTLALLCTHTHTHTHTRLL